MPLIGLLNDSVARLAGPETIGVDGICNKFRLTSLLVSRHFVIVHFTNFSYTPPGHCSGGDMLMLWPAVHSFVCKIV